MAKIIKVTGYFVCPDMDDDAFFNESSSGGCLDTKRIEEVLNGACDVIAKNFTIDDRDIGEWDDDNVLNDVNCPASECEKYFADGSDLIILGKNAAKLSAENRAKLLEIAEEMFKEDFGE